jgi:hypothetical protein
MIHRPLLISFPTPKKERVTERRERKREEKRKIGENTQISKVLLPLPPRAMAEQDWTPSIITLSHLQKLEKQGFMTVAELVACRVPEDPALPVPLRAYVVSFVAFYEQGFGMPPHRFLHSLLWYYGLELHHLAPSGVFHIAPFVTLCEDYLEIAPDFDLWNYFFRVQHL